MEKPIITADTLKNMQNVDIRTVDREDLRDIRDVNVNLELPREQRMLEFLEKIRNPFCYRHGDYIVKVSYADTNVSLQDRILAYIRSKN